MFDDKVSELLYDSDSDTTESGDITSDLATWALENNISLNASGKLLKILRDHGMSVPQDARTLLKTPRSGTLNVRDKSGGSYVFFGVETCLRNALSTVDVNSLSDELHIDMNIDGLPVFKSRHLSVWPIQLAVVNVEELKNKPFVVAIFCGASKPSNLDFLEETLNELQVLNLSGVDGRKCVIRNIICDAPARAMVKGTVQFNGRYGCDYCEVRGVFQGRMLFLTKGDLRTDESFRSERNKVHHKYPSIFLKSGVDMIKQFPIDPMHCVDLGVTKRLLLLWKEGLLPYRLSQKQISQISEFNIAFSTYLPSSVFNRKPRKMDELRLWKATEFRTFLLYVGPVVLKWILPPDEYVLFLSLSVAMRILYNEVLLQSHCQYADELLNYFVSNACARYSKRFSAYNVHCLLHLSQVAQNCGSLINCTAYKYENNMNTIKRSVRGTGCPLVQISNRLAEKTNTSNAKKSISTVHASLSLRADAKCCYKLMNGSFARLHEIKEDVVVCEIFEDTKPLFQKPCNSRLVGIHKGSVWKTKMRTLSIKEIAAQAIVMPLSYLEKSSCEVALLSLNHEVQ